MKITKDVEGIGISEQTILKRTKFREAVIKFQLFRECVKPRRERRKAEKDEAANERHRKYLREVKFGGRSNCRRSK